MEAAREIVQMFLKHVAEMSNSNLIRNANSLMTKNEAKTDTEVEFSWVSDVHLQNQTKFKQGYSLFLETNIVTTHGKSKRILPHVFWFEVLSLLSVFDIINLFIPSKRFKSWILNSSSHYKHVFESMNRVCDEKVLFFVELNIVTTVQTPKRTLTDLPYAFWFDVLTFLSVFDIVNLFISSKRFKGFILNSISNYKHVF